MKIKPAHYAHMKTAIQNALWEMATTIPDYRAFLLRTNSVGDIEKRLRWNLSYAAKMTPWICDNIYSYADDTHIDTALRAIIKELEA